MTKISQLTHEVPPPEIITEILYRLPAKSVGRFRCVSKAWLCLLTDPQFIKTHKEKTLKQHHLIFEPKINKYGDETSFNLYTHPFHEIVVTTPTKFSFELEFAEEIKFCSSCDGLVLVRGNSVDWPTFTFMLVNPTTRENLQLPEDYIHKVRDELDDVDDLNTEVMYGFGYDSVTDDYKVVTITYFNYYTSEEEDADNVEDVYVHVYSLESNIWRRVNAFDSSYHIHPQFSNGVFVNGFIHWIVSKDDNLLVISAFSLADESFREVSFPNLCTNTLNTDSSQLVVLGGKLAIFLKIKDEIWLMNEYAVRESWTKISLHGINQIPLFKPRESYRKQEPLVMDDNDKILVANNDRMMVYDVDKETFSETVCVWNPKNLSVFGSYVESLVSLKHNITKQKSTNSNKEKEEDAEDEESEDLEDEDVEDASEDEDKEDDQDICKAIRAALDGHGWGILQPHFEELMTKFRGLMTRLREVETKQTRQEQMVDYHVGCLRYTQDYHFHNQQSFFQNPTGYRPTAYLRPLAWVEGYGYGNAPVYDHEAALAAMQTQHQQDYLTNPGGSTSEHQPSGDTSCSLTDWPARP